MNKLALIAALSLASSAVLAGEVGAPFPQIVSIAAPTSVVAISVVETGVSSSLTTHTIEALANESQVEEFNAQIDDINARMQIELDKKIAEQLEKADLHF